MPNVTIYHNPYCSKSRQTLQLLLDHDITPTVINYLQTPPNIETLKSILKELDYMAVDLLRPKEKLYKKMKLDEATFTEDELLDLMVKNPILIERPIIRSEKGTVLGRPPQNALKVS